MLQDINTQDTKEKLQSFCEYINQEENDTSLSPKKYLLPASTSYYQTYSNSYPSKLGRLVQNKHI